MWTWSEHRSWYYSTCMNTARCHQSYHRLAWTCLCLSLCFQCLSFIQPQWEKEKLIFEVSLGHTSHYYWWIKSNPLGFWGRGMLVASHPRYESKFMRTLILFDRQSLGVSWWLLFQMAARKSHLKVLLIFVKMDEVRRCCLCLLTDEADWHLAAPSICHCLKRS